MKIVAKPWGEEEWWAEVPGSYLGKILRVNHGEALSLQVHEFKHETMRVLDGTGTLLIGPFADALEARVMLPGDSFAIPPGVVHRVINDGYRSQMLQILEVSTYHPDDVTRLSDDYDRAGQ